MKTLKDYILESQQSQEEYFSELLLCDKDSEFIKTLIDFINDPKAKFTAFGHHPDLVKIAKSLNIGDEWVKKFKNVTSRIKLDNDRGIILNSKHFNDNDKILSDTRFKFCEFGISEDVLDLDSIIIIDDEPYRCHMLFKFTGKPRKDEDKVLRVIRDNILLGMKWGCIKQINKDGKLVKYGISKENICDIVDPEYCTREMLQRLINKYEAKGVKWKYETNEEWKKAGLKDPTED